LTPKGNIQEHDALGTLVKFLNPHLKFTLFENLR
jgi:hypothetical protein